MPARTFAEKLPLKANNKANNKELLRRRTEHVHQLVFNGTLG